MPEIELLRAKSVDDAVALLANHEGSRCIAGGQTMVAMLNAGLVDASVLIAISGINELATLTRAPDGAVRIGAGVSHRVVAGNDKFGGAHNVVRQAAQVIAHPAIRNFGTIGGALAHADPASDYPAAVIAASATIEVAGKSGRRRIAADDFFLDYLTTALAPCEMITAVELPAAANGSAGHYLKFSRVDGDYAIVSVAVAITADAGRCTAARVVLGGCGPTPVFDRDADRELVGGACEPAQIRAAAQRLADRADPVDDVRGSAGYRRGLIPKLVPRAVREAWSRAIGASQ
jgi:aerobic carbon-monoxide dehydrogenase medium subunit